MTQSETETESSIEKNTRTARFAQWLMAREE